MPTIEHRPTTRVLDILQLLSTTKEGFTSTEISAALHIPKSTITPIIHTLLSRQFIVLNPKTEKYIIGISAFIVGYSALSNIDVLDIIKKEMKKIVDKTSETCQLSILIGGDAFYLAKEESNEPIRLISFVGNRLPAYATGIGKALLCDFSLLELQHLYPNGLTAITNHTITDVSLLYKELLTGKKNGYFSEHEESSPGIVCYAVPLHHKEKVIASISISVPKFRLTTEKEQFIIQNLKSAQKKLEQLFYELNIEPNIFYHSLQPELYKKDR